MSSAVGDLQTIVIPASQVRIGDLVHNNLADRHEAATAAAFRWMSVSKVDYDCDGGNVDIWTSSWRTTKNAREGVAVMRKRFPVSGNEVKCYPCLQLNVPHWYIREDFQEWLVKNTKNKQLATWHHAEVPNEYSDIFVTYDNGDGSNDDMPIWYWDEICFVCEQRGLEFALIWLSNLIVD